MVDKVIQGKTRARREFCAFYTESDPILTYMVKKLGIEDSDLILEPCAGDGVFIEKIFEMHRGKDFQVEAMDLNTEAVKNLEDKFDSEKVKVRQADTLLDLTLDLFANSGGRYSKIIGNPPYGAWQDYQKRDALKKRYGGYVKETYTLFLRRCLDLLKEDGKLVFIIPDTFLALHLHTGLRKTLLENTVIDEILLMPSKFFPGVNFGYSNLCIISFEKNRSNRQNQFKIVSVSGTINNLYNLANGDYSVAKNVELISQEKILSSIDYSFLLGGNTKTRKLINEAKTTLGDLADCVTGFYSGDNKTYLMTRDNSVKGSKNYQTADIALVENDFLKHNNLINGLNNGKKYIPILKGGNGRFSKDTDWFIQWDVKTVSGYKKSKTARFQNSKYYFKEGIGVPMVKSSKIHAFLLDKRLFDQSIVGVFPKNKEHLNYLLAFLNSNVCSRILNVINHTANNSANYLKKLPIILDQSTVASTNEIVNRLKKKKIDSTQSLSEIDLLFEKLYSL
jgi:tRNA1(Val) A37 N6-methylase TrmN6